MILVADMTRQGQGSQQIRNFCTCLARANGKCDLSHGWRHTGAGLPWPSIEASSRGWCACTGILRSTALASSTGERVREAGQDPPGLTRLGRDRGNAVGKDHQGLRPNRQPERVALPSPAPTGRMLTPRVSGGGHRVVAGLCTPPTLCRGGSRGGCTPGGPRFGLQRGAAGGTLQWALLQRRVVTASS